MNYFPNHLSQFGESNGAGNQQRRRQAQVSQFSDPMYQQSSGQAQGLQVNNPIYSTPGLYQNANSSWQFGNSNGAENQQPSRQAQGLQVNNPIYSTSGVVANAPAERKMAWDIPVPDISMEASPASSNGQAFGWPDPGTLAVNGPQASTLTAPELEYNAQEPVENMLANMFNEPTSSSSYMLEPSNNQASGHPEPHMPAASSLQGPNPLTSGIEDYEDEEGSGQQGHNWGSLGRQAPAQASRSGPAPQTSGSGYYWPVEQSLHADLSAYGDRPWESQASLFPPGNNNGNQVRGSHASQNVAPDTHFDFGQSYASQTPFASATPSGANNGHEHQALGQEVEDSGTPAFQSSSSSDGLVGALQMGRRVPGAQLHPSSGGQVEGSQAAAIRAARRQPLVSAHGPDLEVGESERMIDNSFENCNNLESVPESPRPPQSNQGQGQTGDPRYCISCRNPQAKFALLCGFCRGHYSDGRPKHRHCIFCTKPASGLTSIVCDAHERRMTVRLSDDEKRVLERERICKRCYKADACTGILKCERCRSDQKRYGATSRESRGQRGICLNCSNSVVDSEHKNCAECRLKKSQGSRLARQQARDK